MQQSFPAIMKQTIQQTLPQMVRDAREIRICNGYKTGPKDYTLLFHSNTLWSKTYKRNAPL